jgi:hypothetical protein
MVTNAIARFRSEDDILLELDVNERTMTHKLAQYLEYELVMVGVSGFSVDCEYNKNRRDQKVFHELPESILSDDLEGKTVYPDIIVHSRNGTDNLLVIEVKKSSSRASVRKDKNKLKRFTGQQFGYRLGAFVKFYVSNRRINPPLVVWFEGGGPLGAPRSLA